MSIAVEALIALATIAALLARRYRIARLTVIAQVGLVVLGFGVAMDRHLILPGLSIDDAGARPEVLEALIAPLVVGAAIVLPSLWFLFRVFKSRSFAGDSSREHD